MKFFRALRQGVQGALNYLKSKNELKEKKINTQKCPNKPKKCFFFTALTPNQFCQGPLSGGPRSPKLFNIQKLIRSKK